MRVRSSCGGFFSTEKARRLQALLSKRVISSDHLPSHIEYVAGVDVAYTDKFSLGAAVVLDYASMEPIETETSKHLTRFPYVPTLLSFRELPPAVSAIRKLRTKADVFFVDGQGLVHPYRLGFASHLGVVLDITTVGVAKNLLCGEIKENGEKGVWKPIVDQGAVIGGAVLTRPRAKPIYVSTGHKISLETAVNLVLRCATKYRIPQPVRLAHLAAQELKRRSQLINPQTEKYEKRPRI